MEQSTIFALVKIVERPEYARSLLRGELYMNSLAYFRGVQGPQGRASGGRLGWVGSDLAAQADKRDFSWRPAHSSQRACRPHPVPSQPARLHKRVLHLFPRQSEL